MIIRILEHDDFPSAYKLMWDTYYEYEKNNTSMEGMEKFRDLISPISLEMNTFDKSIVLYGAFINKELAAVSAVKNKSHILLLYVKKELIGYNLGRTLLEYSEKRCNTDYITVNSSDYAVEFYKKMGYEITSPRKIEEEFIFTPMRKKSE